MVSTIRIIQKIPEFQCSQYGPTAVGPSRMSGASPYPLPHQVYRERFYHGCHDRSMPQGLIPTFSTTTIGLFTFRLHGCSPEEIPQVTVRERLQVPPIAVLHSVVYVGRGRVGPRDDAIARMRVGAVNITGYGIAGIPILVVKSGKLASHSWQWWLVIGESQ